MAPNQRKAREWAARERYLALLALWLVEHSGRDALTHARLSEVSEFSKGTLYNHFPTVEDIVLELSIENVARQVVYMNLIEKWPDPPNVKVFAAVLAYQHHAMMNRTLFDFAVSYRRSAAVETASPERVERRRAVEVQLASSTIAMAEASRVDGHFTPAHLEFEQAIDALRTWLVGYGSVLFDHEFNWEPSTRSRLEITSHVAASFGWSALDASAMLELDHRVAELVATVAAEHSYTSDEPPQWVPATFLSTVAGGEPVTVRGQ